MENRFIKNIFVYFYCFFSIFFCLFLIACNENSNENSNKNSNKNSDSSKINKNVRNVLTIPVSKLPNYSINFAKNNELQNIVFDGIISPQMEYNAAFRVGGKIIQQDIKVGDILSANQILAKLDLTDFILAENIAKSAVNTANSNFITAKNDYLRYKKLAEKNFVSSAMLENKLNILNAAQAQLNHSNNQLKLNTNQKEYAILKNENSKSIVLQKFTEVGQVVAAGQAIYKLAIIDESKAKNKQKNSKNIYEVIVDFPENQIQNLTNNKDNLQFEISILENQIKLFGTLKEISPNANVISKTHQIKIEIANSELKNKFAEIPYFLFGQNAKVKFVYKNNANKNNVNNNNNNTKNVYEIPLNAVQNLQKFNNDNYNGDVNNEVILKIVNSNDNLVKYKKVKIINTNYQNESVVIQTLKDFKANDFIILSGLNMISENEKVKINVIKDDNKRR